MMSLFSSMLSYTSYEIIRNLRKIKINFINNFIAALQKMYHVIFDYCKIGIYCITPQELQIGAPSIFE